MTYKNTSRLVLLADMRSIVVENSTVGADDRAIVPEDRAIMTNDGVQRAGIHIVEVNTSSIEKNVVLVETTTDVRILQSV